MLRYFIMRVFTYPLHAKKIIWTKYIRVFCDGGNPIFRYLPRFRRAHYNPYWGMYGFAVYLFGREINFSLGEDKKGLYN
jgi:hypothetical protein